MNIFEITNIFDWLSGSGSGSATYAPAMWLNHMGLSNKTAVNTRTSTGTVFDHEGLVITTEPGEISIEGARRERNFARDPNDLMQASWVKANSTAATSSLLVFDTIWGKVTGSNVINGFNPGETLAYGVVLSGTGSVKLRVQDNNNAQNAPVDVELTADPRIYTNNYVLGGALTYINLVIDRNNGTATEVTVSDAFMFNASGRSNLAPPEFIDSETDYGYGVNGVKYYDTTNGNTVTDNIVTEAPGHKFVVDGGRKEQNDMFSQQDISKWAATAGVTTVQNADGSWRVTLPAGGTISTASDLANPSVTYDAGRELVTAVAMKLT